MGPTLFRPASVSLGPTPSYDVSLRTPPNLLRGLRRGLRRRCPACGRGALFAGYLAVFPVCSVCGNDNDQYPSEDFAPYVTMLIVLVSAQPGVSTDLGLDIRFVVTSIATGSAEWLYDALYCARGQAENLIKLHKTQLASDRTSRRSALANQVRLVLHTAAYWLMLTVRDAIPRQQTLAGAEFATLRLRLLKIAARVTETVTRVRIAFAAACPEAALFAEIARRLQPAGP